MDYRVVKSKPPRLMGKITRFSLRKKYSLGVDKCVCIYMGIKEPQKLLLYLNYYYSYYNGNLLYLANPALFSIFIRSEVRK